jgi:hypothetical protein
MFLQSLHHAGAAKALTPSQGMRSIDGEHLILLQRLLELYLLRHPASVNRRASDHRQQNASADK